jgi:hypothetical protein
VDWRSCGVSQVTFSTLFTAFCAPFYRLFPFTTTHAFFSFSASIGFLTGMVPPDRKALAVYPVLLFFLVLCWMTVIHFKATAAVTQ